MSFFLTQQNQSIKTKREAVVASPVFFVNRLFDNSQAFDIELVVAHDFRVDFRFDTNQRVRRDRLTLEDMIVDFDFDDTGRIAETIVIALDTLNHLAFQNDHLVVLTVLQDFLDCRDLGSLGIDELCFENRMTMLTEYALAHADLDQVGDAQAAGGSHLKREMIDHLPTDTMADALSKEIGAILFTNPEVEMTWEVISNHLKDYCDGNPVCDENHNAVIRAITAEDVENLHEYLSLMLGID